MGAKGELCKEHRLWHGELASCKDVTISEIYMYVNVPQSAVYLKAQCNILGCVAEM